MTQENITYTRERIAGGLKKILNAGDVLVVKGTVDNLKISRELAEEISSNYEVRAVRLDSPKTSWMNDVCRSLYKAGYTDHEDWVRKVLQKDGEPTRKTWVLGHKYSGYNGVLGLVSGMIRVTPEGEEVFLVDGIFLTQSNTGLDPNVIHSRLWEEAMNDIKTMRVGLVDSEGQFSEVSF